MISKFFNLKLTSDQVIQVNLSTGKCEIVLTIHYYVLYLLLTGIVIDSARRLTAGKHQWLSPGTVWLYETGPEITPAHNQVLVLQFTSEKSTEIQKWNFSQNTIAKYV